MGPASAPPRIVIASQMEESFNAQLRGLAVAPEIVRVPEDRPWRVPPYADLLLIRPSGAWARARGSPRPAEWPGPLRWVYASSAGIDSYPSWLLDAPLVSCGRGVASDEIADYVLAAIYLQSKDLEAARARGPADWVQRPLGRVSGSTLGIVGLGSIGSTVARRALALGMRVTAGRRRNLPSPVDGVELLHDLGEVVASADHLLLALPATPATARIVDAALLAQAKSTLHLVNVARGSILDQQALIAALDAGRLGFATLDVTDPEPLPDGHPLWTHPKVRLTPHVASNFLAMRPLLLAKIAADLERFGRGEPPSDVVDRAAGY